MSRLTTCYSKRILLSVPFLFVLFSLALLGHHHVTDSYYDDDDFRHASAPPLTRAPGGTGATIERLRVRRAVPDILLVAPPPPAAPDTTVFSSLSLFAPLSVLLSSEIPARASPVSVSL